MSDTKSIEMKETEKNGTTEAENDQGREADGQAKDYGFAPDVKLKECRFCRVMIPKQAKICPNCRMSLSRHWIRNLAAAVLALAVIGAGGFYLSVYQGLLPASAIPAWMVRNAEAVPLVSVTKVGTTETAAKALSVETSEVTSETEEQTEQITAEKTSEDGNAAKGLDTAKEDKNIAGDDGIDPTVTDIDEADGDETSQDGTNQDKTSQGETSQDKINEDESDQDKADMNQSDPEQKETASVQREDEEDAEASSGKVIPEDADKDEAAFRENSVQVGYKALLRMQEDYLDTLLMVEAEVVCQVDGGLFDENIYYLCMNEEKNGIEHYYIIRDDRETDATLILEGDMLTVYGQLFGDCKVPAGLIQTRPTVPAISMKYCDVPEE